MFGGLRKRFEEVVAQVNPFDGGKTAATVRSNRARPAPVSTVRTPQGQTMGQKVRTAKFGVLANNKNAQNALLNDARPVQRDVVADARRSVVDAGSRVYDQLNITDNNRTFKQRTPTQDKSTFQQLGQFGGQTARAVGGGTARLANTAAAQVPQVAATARMLTAQATNNPVAWRNANRAALQADERFKRGQGGILNTGTLYNAEEARRGDLRTGLKRIGGGTAESMLEVGSLGVGGVAGKQLVKQGIKQGLKSQLPAIGKNALLNTAQGGAMAFNQDASPRDIAKSALLSGVVGTAGDVGLGIGGAGVSKVTSKLVSNRTPLAANEGGFLRISNPDNANVGGFKINNPDNARVGGLRINNPDGAQTRPLQINNPTGANVTTNLVVRNKTGAPLVGDNLSGAAQQSYLSKIKGRMTPLKGNEAGFVKNPFGKEVAKGLSKEQSDFINQYANMLEDMGSGNGVSKVQNPDGSYVRVSDNYRTGANKGKAMTKADWFDQARKEIESGKGAYGASDEYATLPKVETKPKGFILAESKPRAGRKDTIRVSKDPDSNKLVKTQQSEYVSEPPRIDQPEPVNISDKIVAPKSLQDKPTRQSFETATKRYLGESQAAAFDRQATVANLNSRFKLSESEKINAITAIDSKARPANSKVAQYVDEFRKLTDEAYQGYTSKGLKMGYVEDYLPRIYKNPDTGELMNAAEYELLQRMSGRLKNRTADMVNVDDLVVKDPTELLNKYYSSLDRTVAGRQYLNDLEKNGIVVKSSDPVPGMRPIVAEGLQPGDGTIYYASKDVQQKINRLFGDNQPDNAVEKVLAGGAGLNSFVQSFVLSGGIPNTPLNAFGVMQVMKEAMALHPAKAGKALLAGLSKKNANKLFTENKEYLKMMARNDIDIRVDLQQSAKTGTQRIVEDLDANGMGSAINQAWNEFTNDATFGRFMPALEVMHFKNVYKKAFQRTGDMAKSEQIAAQSTKNFYGKSGNYAQATRSQAAQDAAGALFFAPRFRESMINFWVKNAKSIDPRGGFKNIRSPEYRDNAKFLAASAVTFAAMNAAQNALTGDDLWDNPDGKKDKLLIPGGKLPFDTGDKDIGIPFLPSLATVPRNAAQGVGNLLTGNFEEAGKNAVSFLSMPLKTAGEVLTNQDYFGSPIVDKDATGPERFGQMLSYVGKSNMQPWIREGLNMAGQNLPDGAKKALGVKEKSGVETASNALELPFRFYNPDYYKKSSKFANRSGQESKVKRNGEFTAIKDLPLGDRFQESMKDLSESGDSESIKKIVKEIDGQLTSVYDKWGLPNPGTDTRVAEIWSDYDKRVRSGKVTDISKRAEEKKLLRSIYRSTASKQAREFLGIYSDNDMRTAIRDGVVDKKALDEAIQLDNFIVQSGLQTSPTVGNKLRRELGYASLSKSGSRGGRRSGGGRGRKRAGKFDWTKNMFADGGAGSGSVSKKLRQIIEEASKLS